MDLIGTSPSPLAVITGAYGGTGRAGAVAPGAQAALAPGATAAIGIVPGATAPGGV